MISCLCFEKPNAWAAWLLITDLTRECRCFLFRGSVSIYFYPALCHRTSVQVFSVNSSQTREASDLLCCCASLELLACIVYQFKVRFERGLIKHPLKHNSLGGVLVKDFPFVVIVAMTSTGIIIHSVPGVPHFFLFFHPSIFILFFKKKGIVSKACIFKL